MSNPMPRGSRAAGRVEELGRLAAEADQEARAVAARAVADRIHRAQSIGQQVALATARERATFQAAADRAAPILGQAAYISLHTIDGTEIARQGFPPQGLRAGQVISFVWPEALTIVPGSLTIADKADQDDDECGITTAYTSQGDRQLLTVNESGLDDGEFDASVRAELAGVAAAELADDDRLDFGPVTDPYNP